MSPQAITHVRPASSTGDCPALTGGTGVLPDGDFSQTVDPLSKNPTYDKGHVFAPNWVVYKRNIDFNGSTYWDMDGLCSVDLDGYYEVGGIETSEFSTKPGATYMLSLVFSGNGDCAPTIKTLKVSINNQFTTYNWDTSNGNNPRNGDFTTETWNFKGAKRPSILRLASQDPKGSSCGPVIAGMAIKGG